MGVKTMDNDFYIRQLEHEVKLYRTALKLAAMRIDGSNCHIQENCPEDKDCNVCYEDYLIKKAGFIVNG